MDKFISMEFGFVVVNVGLIVLIEGKVVVNYE